MGTLRLEKDLILNRISQGFLWIDLEGNIVACNKAAERLLGKRSDEMLLHSFWQNFDDKILGFSMEEALVAKDGQIRELFISYEHPGGEHKELKINTTFLPYPTPGILVLMEDHTEMGRLSKMVERNERLQELGEMAALIAHEIRNPLGGIKGFASLLFRDLKERPELQKVAAHIMEGTDTLNRFVSTILNYAKPFQLEMENVNLVDLGQELFDILKADVHTHPKIKMVLTHSTEIVVAPFDRTLLRCALLNLLVNAIQAMPEGGILELKIKVTSWQATLHIRDTGVGITKENKEKLFSPFFTTRKEGNGFGLAEVQKIVDAHQGSITVHSEVNQGTTFTLRFPIKKRDGL